MVKQKITIYFLKCPMTNKLRYIGRTKNDLTYRLNGHMTNVWYESTKEKREWIDELKEKGLRAIIVPIEVVYSYSAAIKAEQKWIMRLRKNNIRIFNSKRFKNYVVNN